MLSMKPEHVNCIQPRNLTTVAVPSDELHFRPSVYGIIVKDGCVLLPRQFGDGFTFLGGGIDKGERIIDALVREVKEESGLDVVVGELAAVRDGFFSSLRDSSKHYHGIFLFYWCEIVGGQISTDFFDTHEKNVLTEAQWVPFHEIPNIKMYYCIDGVALLQEIIGKKYGADVFIA